MHTPPAFEVRTLKTQSEKKRPDTDTLVIKDGKQSKMRTMQKVRWSAWALVVVGSAYLIWSIVRSAKEGRFNSLIALFVLAVAAGALGLRLTRRGAPTPPVRDEVIANLVFVSLAHGLISLVFLGGFVHAIVSIDRSGKYQVFALTTSIVWAVSGYFVIGAAWDFHVEARGEAAEAAATLSNKA